MSKQTPFFKFDAMQWLGGSIQFCTLEEKGLFIDLCAMYWESQKPIPIDNKFKVRYRNLQGTLDEIIGTLSDLGIIEVSDLGIWIPFLASLIDEREKWLEKCSKAGKKSASLQGTSSNKKEERRKKNVESREKKEEKFGYTAEFENFWKEYQRKGSKANALKRWKKLTQQERLDAFSAIEPYFIEKPEAQFRKDAEGYLSGKLFESVLERSSDTQGSQSQQPAGLGITMNPGYMADLQAGLVSSPQEWLDMKRGESNE